VFSVEGRSKTSSLRQEKPRGPERSQAKPPKVFLSHASEDKKFVLDFAARVETARRDAWLDRWEILPGTGFVRKIFDEGLAQRKPSSW